MGRARYTHTYVYTIRTTNVKHGIHVQLNPSNPDTNGTEEIVHVSEVSLFQVVAQHCFFGEVGVLITGVSPLQGYPYRKVPLKKNMVKDRNQQELTSGIPNADSLIGRRGGKHVFLARVPA